MARSKYGLGANSSITPPTSIPLPNSVLPAGRVKDIILDDKHRLFKNFGGWGGIGIVEFIPFNSIDNNKDTIYTQFAKPLFPNLKNFPLKNEVIYLFQLPFIDSQNNVGDTELYYINAINLWNTPHHNALVFNKNNEDLGDTFEERDDIHSLLPYEGDIICEGRWGNSLRFGSTVTNAAIKNTWSNSGTNGNPIIIFRNGQGKPKGETWKPITEDINKDESSLYMTSTQEIPIKTSNHNYKSYDNAPVKPDKYNNKQILLNSGRLVLNSYEDSILMSAEKSINLNTLGTINIDSKNKMVVNSPKIYLGGKDASEPILLGNKTVELLKEYFSTMQASAAQWGSTGTPIPFSPNPGMIEAGAKVVSICGKLIGQLETLKSKRNFTE